MSESEVREARKEGYLEALYDWAWWKDGEMYVGSRGTTYKQAKADWLKKNGYDPEV